MSERVLEQNKGFLVALLVNIELVAYQVLSSSGRSGIEKYIFTKAQNICNISLHDRLLHQCKNFKWLSVFMHL